MGPDGHNEKPADQDQRFALPCCAGWEGRQGVEYQAVRWRRLPYIPGELQFITSSTYCRVALFQLLAMDDALLYVGRLKAGECRPEGRLYIAASRVAHQTAAAAVCGPCLGLGGDGDCWAQRKTRGPQDRRFALPCSLPQEFNRGRFPGAVSYLPACPLHLPLEVT